MVLVGVLILSYPMSWRIFVFNIPPPDAYYYFFIGIILTIAGMSLMAMGMSRLHNPSINKNASSSTN
jgi:hypothetical protein